MIRKDGNLAKDLGVCLQQTPRVQKGDKERMGKVTRKDFQEGKEEREDVGDNMETWKPWALLMSNGTAAEGHDCSSS